MKRLLIVTAGAVGFLLGSRAGREPYEQFMRAIGQLKDDPRVQAKAHQGAQLVREQAPVVADKVADAARTATDKVTSAVSGSTDAGSDRVRVTRARTAKPGPRPVRTPTPSSSRPCSTRRTTGPRVRCPESRLTGLAAARVVLVDRRYGDGGRGVGLERLRRDVDRETRARPPRATQYAGPGLSGPHRPPRVARALEPAAQHVEHRLRRHVDVQPGPNGRDDVVRPVRRTRGRRPSGCARSSQTSTAHRARKKMNPTLPTTVLFTMPMTPSTTMVAIPPHTVSW